MTNCPDIETLAAFAEGKLKRHELPPIVDHVQDCVRCMAAVEAVVESSRPVSTTSRTWWLAAAAAVVIAVIGITFFRPRSPMSRLIALAPTDARLVEPRLSGGFGWAPYRGSMRGPDTTDRLKLGGAAAELIDHADRDHHAAGVAMLLVDRPEQAIEQLRIAAERAPENAKSWSDLAAARYATALDLARPSLYPEALAAADRALRIDPKLAEAQFNRALILERMGLTKEARNAWQQYLEIDPSSKWSTEAREHLKIPRGATGASPAVPRALAEVEYLAQWGETGTSRPLEQARAIAATLTQSNEYLLHDSILAIAAHPAPLAEAHQLYRRGRIAYARQNLADAERDLRLAATRFEQGQSPMALMARYYAACVRYDRGDIAAARAELESLLGHKRYLALDAQVRWELALCLGMDDDLRGAQALLEQSEAQFTALGERANAASVQSVLASALVALGRPDDAWAARIRSFRVLSEQGDDARLAPFVAGAARMSLRAGRLEAAAPLMQIEASLVRNNDVLLANTLTREAVLQDALGDARAEKTAADAALVARRIKQPELRARAEADAKFAEGAAAVRRDPRHAIALLSSAAEVYRAKNMTAFLPETHLLRARAALAIGDKNAAADDLEKGVSIFEQQRVDVGTGVLDAGTALFDEAIRLALARGDHESAFAYAERSRGSSSESLRQQLAGSDVAVLALHLLGDEVIAFCVTEKGMSVARSSARDDYERFIRPSEDALRDAKELIVVPDPRLEAISFGALYDARRKQYLIERMAVAEGCGRLVRTVRTRTSAPLVSVALPSGPHALPETIAEVGASNARPTSFAAFADAAKSARIIHIAGHTERQPGAGDVALLFQNGERVSWKTIAARRFDNEPTVVLAACETLRAPRSPGIRTRSLGEAFLDAGAGAVIGTLAPIADRDASELFRAVHQRLAAGATASEALRGAQLELMNRNPAWKSVAVITREIHAKENQWAKSRSTSTASARKSANSLPTSE